MGERRYHNGYAQFASLIPFRIVKSTFTLETNNSNPKSPFHQTPPHVMTPLPTATPPRQSLLVLLPFLPLPEPSSTANSIPINTTHSLG
jgi:hypothetical protein